jgi:hypothetical protein
VEEKRKKEEKPDMPSHVQTFDPQNPPFVTQRLCIYLRELEEEKEKEALKQGTDPTLHK